MNSSEGSKYMNCEVVTQSLQRPKHEKLLSFNLQTDKAIKGNGYKRNLEG